MATEEKLPCSIMIAEDNPADVTLVREALKAHDVDCDIHVLRDGEQAISFISKLDADPGMPPVHIPPNPRPADSRYAPPAIQRGGDPPTPALDGILCADSRNCDDGLRL